MGGVIPGSTQISEDAEDHESNQQKHVEQQIIIPGTVHHSVLHSLLTACIGALVSARTASNKLQQVASGFHRATLGSISAMRDSTSIGPMPLLGRLPIISQMRRFPAPWTVEKIPGGLWLPARTLEQETAISLFCYHPCRCSQRFFVSRIQVCPSFCQFVTPFQFGLHNQHLSHGYQI